MTEREKTHKAKMRFTEMFKLNPGSLFRRTLNERAEAMPATIISAIVSAILMVSIASIMALIMQNKAISADDLTQSSNMSAIDSSMRADITAATYSTASVRLVNPSGGGPINANSLFVSGVNLHIPAEDGSNCRLVRWSLIHGTLTRSLTIYSGTSTNNSLVQCDTTSTVLGSRTKTFAQNLTLDSDNYQVLNQAGRTIVFTITEPTLDNINAQLNSDYTAQGSTNQLPDSQFDQLNSMLTTSSIAPAFADPNACIMNQPKDSTTGKCPTTESNPLTTAWNSMTISKVLVAFHLVDPNTQVTYSRSIEQNISTSIYTMHQAVGEPQQ